MARKVLLIIIAKLFSRSPAAQIGLVLVVLGAALSLQIACKPFLSDEIDRVERGLLAGCVAIALLGVGSHYGAASDAKDVGVTAAYFIVLVSAAATVAAPMRRIWRGEDSASASSGAADVAGIATKAKFVI